MLRSASLRLWRWILAVTAVALCLSPLLQLTGTWAPWTKLAAELWELASPDGLLRSAPTPAVAAVRKNLAQRLARGSATAGLAEDLTAAIAFYEARNGPLLWVTESGISERGNRVIREIRKADDWGLNARDFALPKPIAGPVSPELEAATEIELTFAVLKYARYARGGRFSDP